MLTWVHCFASKTKKSTFKEKAFLWSKIDSTTKRFWYKRCWFHIGLYYFTIYWSESVHTEDDMDQCECVWWDMTSSTRCMGISRGDWLIESIIINILDRHQCSQSTLSAGAACHGNFCPTAACGQESRCTW